MRHCEAMGNYKRLFQGHTDADISENGVKQLEALAACCEGLSFDAAYSSPLIRAQKTAMAAIRGKDLALQLDRGLMEIDGGCWEGKPWTQLPELYPEMARRWYEEPWNFQADGGESMREVRERVCTTIQQIARRHAGQSVCVVSHGCAIRNLLCWAAGLPIERLNEIDWCDNTAISILELDEELAPSIVRMNDSSHLNDEISTFSKQTWWRRGGEGTAAHFQ